MDTRTIPNHVAIIPDGNRRWARARGLEPWQGHEAGSENAEALIREARKIGIRELSFWGSSLDNLKKRPLAEKQALLRIYGTYFRKLLESREVFEDEVRIRFIGRWREQFPSSLTNLLTEIEKKTAHHSRHFLNFFLAYSGVDDMLQAFKNVASRGLSADSIDESTVKESLMTAELSPVDLLIRTGDGFHNSSGFLMWEVADSQLSFSEKLFPDFDPATFREAVEEFSDRERRFGK
ncbi:MAG: polyprenyl diphosphate synthase [Candidatus Moraniibacteriota bacterium]